MAIIQRSSLVIYVAAFMLFLPIPSYAATASCNALSEILWQHALPIEDSQHTLNLKGFDQQTLDIIHQLVLTTRTNYQACTIPVDFDLFTASTALIDGNSIVRKPRADSDDWDTFLIFGFDNHFNLRYANLYRSAKFTSCSAASAGKNLSLHCEGGDQDDGLDYKVIFNTQNLKIQQK